MPKLGLESSVSELVSACLWSNVSAQNWKKLINGKEVPIYLFGCQVPQGFFRKSKVTWLILTSGITVYPAKLSLELLFGYSILYCFLSWSFRKLLVTDLLLLTFNKHEDFLTIGQGRQGEFKDTSFSIVLGMSQECHSLSLVNPTVCMLSEKVLFQVM